MPGEWNAWRDTPYLEFVHRRARELLILRGAESRLVQLNAQPVHYYVAGPKGARERALLVHGLGDSSHTWAGLLPRLADTRRVYALDLPGHGFSPLPSSREFLHVREHAGLVEAFAREVLEGKAHALVGHSMGGWVAAKAAAKPPPGLARLVLVAPAGLAYDGMGRELDLLRVNTERDVKRLWRHACYRVPWELRVLRKEVARLFQSSSISGFLQRANSKDILTEEDLSRITVPTTLIWGRNDGLVPPHLAMRFEGAIPGARVLWIDRCGHTPQLERQRAYLQVLESALQAGEMERAGSRDGSRPAPVDGSQE